MHLAHNLDIMDSHVGIFERRNLYRIDWVMSLVVLSLVGSGLSMLYSASRTAPTEYYYLIPQIRYVLLGLFASLVIVCADRRVLVSMAPLMYAGSIALLIAVMFFGEEVKGGRRWLVMGGLRLQPSEVAKLALIYMLAWYFTAIGEKVRTIRYFLLTFLIAAIPGILILKQPNLGTAATLGPIVFVMLYVAGCKRWHLGVLVFLGLMVIPLVWWQLKDFEPSVRTESAGFYELKHHQKERIYTFLHPESDPRETGWQALQSKITVGSGGLTGKGYLKGTQTFLKYLPEHHTDFIFSLLAEELGFAGGMCIIGLFLIFLLRGLQFSADCADMAGSLLAAGVVALLGFHVFVNIAITIGLLPVTGLPLPFFSYGGSFCLTSMMCVGVLLNVHITKRFLR